MPKPKRDPRVLFGIVTAVTYAAIMGGKLAVWGLEDKTHIPLILAPLLLIVVAIVGYRWWVKTRHADWVKSGGRDQVKVGVTARTCKKCGTVLDGVKPKPVSIGGLNVVRVVCPKCGRVEG